ncbi:MAG: flagellar biosynthesis anti-sigma factor FlgM [Oscillospiraceae bacterium]|nr:flagellar biosynthesis anti-sigma factor FlgM [Oscillospiraceae bacterium]
MSKESENRDIKGDLKGFIRIKNEIILKILLTLNALLTDTVYVEQTNEKVEYMKINPITNPNILRSYQATKVTKEESTVVSNRDELTLSPEALSIAKAKVEAKNQLEFRTAEEKAHIAKIKEAVRNGEYRIDSEDIVDSILSRTSGV